MLNKIINCDVVEGLKSLRDNSFDLVIVDPPYGIKKDFGIQDSYLDVQDWVRWCGDWLIECKRVLAPNGSIVVYGIHNYLCFLQVELYRLGLHYIRQLIWHYDNGFCGHTRLPRATYEPLLWFSKDRSFYFDPIREPYKSVERLKYKVTKNGKVWRPNPEGRIVGDVWYVPTLAGRRFKDEKVAHPSQKPLALCDRLVQHLARPGAQVLVPFAGSGSECVSAFQNGRQFLAFELNKAYCELAEQRLRSVGWAPSSGDARRRKVA